MLCIYNITMFSFKHDNSVTERADRTPNRFRQHDRYFVFRLWRVQHVRKRYDRVICRFALAKTQSSSELSCNRSCSRRNTTLYKYGRLKIAYIKAIHKTQNTHFLIHTQYFIFINKKNLPSNCFYNFFFCNYKYPIINQFNSLLYLLAFNVKKKKNGIVQVTVLHVYVSKF